MIKTKIVATVGPSCSQPEILKAMIDNGVDVFRLNFSHGTLDEHVKLLEALNEVRVHHHNTTAVMGDLCGPKIRTSGIDPEGQTLDVGDEVNDTTRSIMAINFKVKRKPSIIRFSNIVQNAIELIENSGQTG